MVVPRTPKYLRLNAEPNPGGDVQRSLGTKRYVSDRPIPTFQYQKYVNHRWVCEQANTGDIVDFEATHEGVTTRIRVRPVFGGAIFELGPVINGTFLNVVNHGTEGDAEIGDYVGRLIQSAIFLADASGFHNPTQAGSAGGAGDQSDSYSEADTLQFSPTQTYRSHRNLDGSLSLRVLSVPLEFNCVPHGGSAHNPIIWPEMLLGLDITIHPNGMPGVVRCDGLYSIPFDQEISGAAIGVPTVHIRHGFDKVYAWNTRNPTGIRIDNANIYTGLSSDENDWELDGVTVTVTAAEHGRVVGTQHYVTFSSSTQAPLDGTRVATFNAAGTFTVTLSAAEAFAISEVSTTGTADIDSPTVLYYDKANTQERVGYVGTTLVKPSSGTSTDQFGYYTGKSNFDVEGYHALIWRADGTEAWSLADGVETSDLSVALYAQVTPQQQVSRLFTWVTNATADQNNGANAEDTQVMSAYREFGSGTYIPSGMHSHPAWIIVGTHAEVLSRLVTFDATFSVMSERIPGSGLPPIGGPGDGAILVPAPNDPPGFDTPISSSETLASSD